MVDCPVNCGSGPFGTEHGAVMHAINTDDNQHSTISTQSEAYTALLESQNSPSEDNSEDNSGESDSDSPERLEFPESPDGPNPDVDNPSPGRKAVVSELDSGPDSGESDSEGSVRAPGERESGESGGPVAIVVGAVVVVGVVGVLLRRASGGSTNSENSLPVV